MWNTYVATQNVHRRTLNIYCGIILLSVCENVWQHMDGVGVFLPHNVFLMPRGCRRYSCLIGLARRVWWYQLGVWKIEKPPLLERLPNGETPLRQRLRRWHSGGLAFGKRSTFTHNNHSAKHATSPSFPPLATWIRWKKSGSAFEPRKNIWQCNIMRYFSVFTDGLWYLSRL